MALRLIEMELPEKNSEEIRELLKEHTVLEYRQLRLPDGAPFACHADTPLIAKLGEVSE